MLETYFPQEASRLEIQAYKRPRDPRELKKTHVPFTGSPRKHPYDQAKILLVADPYGSATFYYEFNGKDIDYVEELPKVVNVEGKAITMARVWVKKRSIGLRATPFMVEETSRLRP